MNFAARPRLDPLLKSELSIYFNVSTFCHRGVVATSYCFITRSSSYDDSEMITSLCFSRPRRASPSPPVTHAQRSMSLSDRAIRNRNDTPPGNILAILPPSCVNRTVALVASPLQILTHPWMCQGHTKAGEHDLSHFKSSMKAYNARRKFKATIMTVQMMRAMEKNADRCKSLVAIPSRRVSLPRLSSVMPKV